MLKIIRFLEFLNLSEKPSRDQMKTKSCTASGTPQYGLALSSLVSERQVDYMQNINDGCLMTLSPITTPCCRNTFVILSTQDESLHGEKMNYGDEFLLRAVNYGDPDAPPLYVRYTPDATPGPADRMPIRLSSTKDSNCRWTTMPLLPCDRLEGLGSPVKTGTRLIVKNCVADKSLFVMNQSWMQTFFGPECGVTCRNYIDIHKRYTAENIFTMVSDVATKKQG
ncbi:cilia- and flagella-associated protein 161 isoform X2 [Plodia interpunctella]|uniref:cilia- and flagella-associated protein 161 isoform X2 n=1 Tax=Plodia interpunctella TaxID=58824 RepID=UPI002367E191|nr:cilia- and flagella-associated protein 161 isoform X2 [Plodia interpunctella]